MMRMEKLSELPLDDLSMFIMQCIQNFLACFQGVKSARDEGITKIDLETDAFR